MKKADVSKDVKTGRLIISEKGEPAGTVPKGVSFGTTAPAEYAIFLAENNVEVGYIRSSISLQIAKTAELEFAIYPEYKGEGYAAEAIEAISEKLFSGGEIYYIRVKVKREDKARAEMLRACGFEVRNSDENENDNDDDNDNAEYLICEKAKEKPFYMSVHMMIGMAVGMALGTVFGKTAAGMTIGMCFGAILGSLFDRKDSSERKR